MPFTFQANSLLMEWCLDCHRHPEREIRPREEVFNMKYKPPADQLELGPPADEGIRHRTTRRFSQAARCATDEQPQESRIRTGGTRASRSAARPGKQSWRSLDELAGTPGVSEVDAAGVSPARPTSGPIRSAAGNFLSLMGASLALAGLSGCSVKPAPLSKIVPYVKPPRRNRAGGAAVLCDRP